LLTSVWTVVGVKPLTVLGFFLLESKYSKQARLRGAKFGSEVKVWLAF
jgi:hypothetical protein